MSAPQPAPVVDQGDVNAWTDRFNKALTDHTIITAPTPEHNQTWNNGFFECFSPIDLCCISWCLPCVTFGKTYHRLHKDSSMQGYSAVNTSCLMFTGFTCFGLHWIPMMFQRAEIRKKFGLQGDFVTDLLKSCCCGCCALVQEEKETEQREGLLKLKVEEAGYKPTDGMTYKQ